MNKKPYCLMPFIHLHVGYRGRVQACCVANIPFGNVNEQSVEEIWNGEAIQQLREKFLRGESDNRCANCQQLEAAGADSMRLETFRKFDFQQINEQPAHPVYFDIRFSNVCNFRCRTCWHGASSRWFNDAKALGKQAAATAIISNIDDVEKFIRQSENALSGAEEFYFAGGEPLVTEAHYVLLDWLVQRGATKARLRYNTNFSRLGFKDYDVLDYWQHFPKVTILASIDASESLGEYIRKDMVWADILKNRKRINALPHLHFQLAPTVSVFNVLHLPELYEQCLELEMISPEDWYINILERPYHYSIQALPKAKKEQVEQHYTDFLAKNLAPKIKKDFEDILAYLQAEDRSNYWPKFQQETQQLDELRGERWGTFF